jgi:acetaldehyde dehydrogenase/alcohol dehydrogenase
MWTSAFVPYSSTSSVTQIVQKYGYGETKLLRSTKEDPHFMEKIIANTDEAVSDQAIKDVIEKQNPKGVLPQPKKVEPKEFPIKPEHQVKLDEMKTAQEEFAKLTQEDADRIFDAISREVNMHRLPLAKMAREETGMGQFEDKVLKNGLAAELIHDRYAKAKTCGIINEDKYHGITTYAYPVGPICCLTPITVSIRSAISLVKCLIFLILPSSLIVQNPTSTVIAKALMMAKTRNAGIFLPHPRASRASSETVRICQEAGEKAGAPKGWLQVIENPSMDESNSVMKSDEVRLILSTGGPGIVKASYSSGKPAIGVGSGNAPVLVDETADLNLAVGGIVSGKTFDNGMICASEQSAVVVDTVYDELKQKFIDRGVHFVYSEDREKLGKVMRKDGRINPDVVGQTAKEIAALAGIDVATIPEHTIILATEEEKHAIGPDYAFSHEKLAPIISLYRADDFDEALDLCNKLVNNGGIGHTAGLYTNTDSKAAKERESAFVKSVPVGRVLINSPTSLAAIGSAFNFEIDPSFSIGVGTLAGSSVSNNVGPLHLINLVNVAERQEHIEWFNLPGRIFFNRGCLEEGLRECGKTYATGERDQRVMIVSGRINKKLGYVDRVANNLKSQGFEVDEFLDTHADPDMECIRKGVEACERFKPDLMIALGGGSPIDAAKMIRLSYEHPELTLPEAASRFIELRKRTVQFPYLGSKIRRLVTIPTTSGTGSEVSPFTVITDDSGHKFPIASYKLTPDIAICDSTLCDTLPKSLVANAGVDAITHAIESYVSVAQNDFTKMHSLEALELLFENLVESYEEGTAKARDCVHRGSTLAGIAFSNAFLGINHSLSHKVGAEFHLPHGLTNAILLQHVIRYNADKKPTR